MESEPQHEASRSSTIGERIDTIRARIRELRADRGPGGWPGLAIERLVTAQHHAAVSRAAAEQAAAASVAAFGKAARAHEQAAAQHEKSAEAGSGDPEEHRWRAAAHRAAATRDWQRAERARSRAASPVPPAKDPGA